MIVDSSSKCKWPTKSNSFVVGLRKSTLHATSFDMQCCRLVPSKAFRENSSLGPIWLRS